MAELDRREKEFASAKPEDDIVHDVEPILRLLVDMSPRMSCSQLVMLVKF